jgi:hypothetical protein
MIAMKTSSSSKNTIIVSIILIVTVVLVYFYFEGSTTPFGGSLLQSQAGGSVGSAELTLLGQIQSLKIDVSLFTDPSYETLQDYSVAIPTENVGRPNPFAPLLNLSSAGSQGGIQTGLGSTTQASH